MHPHRATIRYIQPATRASTWEERNEILYPRCARETVGHAPVGDPSNCANATDNTRKFSEDDSAGFVAASQLRKISVQFALVNFGLEDAALSEAWIDNVHVATPFGVGTPPTPSAPTNGCVEIRATGGVNAKVEWRQVSNDLPGDAESVTERGWNEIAETLEEGMNVVEFAPDGAPTVGTTTLSGITCVATNCSRLCCSRTRRAIV